MRKFRGTTHPEAGQERVFYGRANDPDIASQILHGVSTKTSLVVRIFFINSCYLKRSLLETVALIVARS